MSGIQPQGKIEQEEINKNKLLSKLTDGFFESTVHLRTFVLFFHKKSNNLKSVFVAKGFKRLRQITSDLLTLMDQISSPYLFRGSGFKEL